MTIDQLNKFISEHRYHTMSIEMKNDTGLISGVPDNFENYVYRNQDNRILGMDKRYVKAVYCCGEVCK